MRLRTIVGILSMNIGKTTAWYFMLFVMCSITLVAQRQPRQIKAIKAYRNTLHRIEANRNSNQIVVEPNMLRADEPWDPWAYDQRQRLCTSINQTLSETIRQYSCAFNFRGTDNIFTNVTNAYSLEKTYRQLLHECEQNGYKINFKVYFVDADLIYQAMEVFDTYKTIQNIDIGKKVCDNLTEGLTLIGQIELFQDDSNPTT